MKKEIDSLREEIGLVKARGSSSTRSSENNEGSSSSLREEIKMSLRTSRTPNVMGRFRSRPRPH
eukprot:CAMPEP_0202018994 /NCGR_PEP_ID=MMETSP0905-20130828/40836_1 /ASSEMBLY_ACC=CAM_ASM_000554 /TAXON_ID=420261 /ORGANISM="Thalassiosira antarctica, Strain CCMP982" /LENGTH=63 /DNA_ID=CAMNT_0048580115 /DNA_START=12 /DNA_END=200 /DNA_ORIENTATION=+